MNYTYTLGYQPVFDRLGAVIATRLALVRLAVPAELSRELGDLIDPAAGHANKLPGLVLKALPIDAATPAVVCIRDLATLSALIPNAVSTPPAHLKLGLDLQVFENPEIASHWMSAEWLGRTSLRGRLVAQGPALRALAGGGDDHGTISAMLARESGLDWHAIEQPADLEQGGLARLGDIARRFGRRGAQRWRGPHPSSVELLSRIQGQRTEQPHAADGAFGGVPRTPWAPAAGPSAAAKSSSRSASSASIGALIELMGQIDRNERPEVMEATLQRESALAYKLLAYLNSAAFGLPVEVSGFRHAVLLLGRARMKRWLALGLATANADPTVRPLVWAALRRAFLMEELALAQQRHAASCGRELTVSRETLDHLFVCGLFSLLDHLLQRPMKELLAVVSCPPPMVKALVEGQGGLMPYLDLAQRIERMDIDLALDETGERMSGAPLEQLLPSLECLALPLSEVNVAIAQALARAQALG